jgi:hypothetical protein
MQQPQPPIATNFYLDSGDAGNSNDDVTVRIHSLSFFLSFLYFDYSSL